MAGAKIMGATLLALGIFVCYQGLDLTLGRPSSPGPGFVPFLLGLVLTGLAAIYLYNAGRGGTEKTERGDGSGFRRLLIAVAAICFYALAVTRLGYLLTTFLLFAVWLSLIERKNWVQTVSLACAAVAAVYLFNTLFSVQLPTGLLKGIVR